MRTRDGIEDDFVVIDILPCPTPAEGDGQLVTTKFIHENAEVYDLKVEGSSDTIGTTAGHRFWSEDRQDFVPISEFRIGEQLELADGTLVRLEALRPRSHLETVYNIEVDGEHVYRVGTKGLLVHNSCTEYVYLIRNINSGAVKYVGITKNLTTRSIAHRLSGTLKRGEELVAVTKKIKHAHARVLESKLLHAFTRSGQAAGVFDNTHQIWYQLKKSGLRNANRGRLRGRWNEGVGQNTDVFDDLISEKVGNSLNPIGL